MICRVISFTVYGVPIPQGSTKAFMPKGGRFPIVTADNAKTKPWRQAIVDEVRTRISGGGSPADGPLVLRVTFYLPRPKSARRDVLEPGKKPDLDKLVRAVGDALTAAGVWRDDSQVVEISARKAFAAGRHDPSAASGVPRAEISVSEVANV